LGIFTIGTVSAISTSAELLDKNSSEVLIFLTREVAGAIDPVGFLFLFGFPVT
jgi:hypothetical protein